MKITTFLLADNVIKSPHTQKISIENIFNNISAKSFPAIHKQLVTVTIFEGEDKKYKYQVILEHKTQKIVIVDTIIEKRGGREHTIVSVFNDTPLMEPGDYVFKVKLDGQVAEKLIKVLKI